MTPSATRPPTALARRTRLLAASALCGVAAMLASPALAGTLPGIPSAANITVSSGGSQPTISFPDAITLQIDLNAPRTVINWADLHLSSGDAMNFLFDAASDIVLNKTTSQIRFDSGSVVTGKVGAATAGNVWFYSPQGVIVSPGATMTAGGFLFSRGSGINDVSFVGAADPLADLRAATDALIRMTTISSATSASINSTGDVVLSASSGALNVSTADGATVDISTTAGSITASEVIATSGVASVAAGGPGATVTQITGATGVTVSSNSNTSVGAATTSTSGDILITSNGSASLTLGNSARDLTLSAPQVFVSTIDAGRDVFITGTTSAFVTNRIFAGDDIEITADGDVSAGGAYLKSTGAGATDDAHILLRSDTGFVNAGNTLLTQGTGVQAGDITIQAATTASLGTADASRDIKVSGVTASLANGSAARDVFVTATIGSATVTTTATAGDDVEVTASLGAVNAGGATLRSNGTGADDGHVLARSLGGSVTVGAAETLGAGVAAGDVTLTAALSAATLGSGQSSRDLLVSGVTAGVTTGGAARDVFITAGTGSATVVTSLTAGDDVEVTSVGGFVLASGATLRSTGIGASDEAHVLAQAALAATVGTAITEGTGATAGDITISGLAATLDSGSSSRDLTVSGFGGATLTSGEAARVLSVTTVSGDVTVVTSATAGDDVEITTGGGDVLAGAATLTATGVGATNDSHVLLRSTSGAIDFGTAIAQGTGVAAGDVTVDSAGGVTGLDAQASRDVSVTAAGAVDLASATAERDITVSSTGGGAILGAARLTGTGAGHDLLVSASDDAILGAPDYSSITTANVFSRTGGNTGTATVRSTAGDAKVYLDTSAAIDTLEGLGVDATVNTGPATFGAITASIDDLYVEVLDGPLTVDTASAVSGDLDLNAFGGDLTVTGSVQAGGLAHLAADGLLDGTSASLIDGVGGVQLYGGGVDVGLVTSQGTIDVAAATGDAAVQSAQGDVVQVGATGDAFVGSAEAVTAAFVVAGGDALVDLVKVTDAAGFAIVHGDDDATVRAAEAPAGVLVDAVNKATFGADDEASITAANYLVSDPGCGCGSGGLQVTSTNGDAVVFIDTASNGIGVVGASQTGNAVVVQKTGDLLIEEVAGYNVALKAATGTLETGFTTVADGDYTITAHDFLGDALTPTLFNGLVRDVTITDTLGGLNLGTTAIHADRRLTIAAQGGAVTGAAQLSAGIGLADGRVTVTGAAIAVDTVTSDGLVNLDGGLGLVNVATGVSVDGDYTLKGGDFSTNALAPLGLKAGLWSINDRAGGFAFTGTPLHYGGALALFVNGVVNGGDITVDTDTITVEAASGRLGALSAGGASIAVDSTVGGIAVDAAEAGSLIRIQALNGGAASLGAATLTGAGTNRLIVKAFNGDAVLGAATPGAITAANLVSSAGATTTVDVTAPAGKVDINLDHITGADLTTVSALHAAKVKVAHGALTVRRLTAGATSQVIGDGDTRLVSADVAGDLTVSSASGGLRFGDATPGRVIDVSGVLSLDAATDITQQGALHAFALGATSGTGIVLLGDNQVQYLDAIDVGAGGFAFHDTVGFELNGPVDAVGQTVDLRSDGAITQASTGVITAQRLVGSSVGGAAFGTFNQVVRLGDFTNTGGGQFRLLEGRSLIVDGVVLSAGSVSLTSHAGMTLAATGRVQANGTGDAAVLVSDGVFTNARGADAVTTANGRWLIYTQAVGNAQGSTAGNTFNGLSGKSFYGSAYDFFNEQFAVAPNAGNRFVYAYQPTITVTPDSKVVTYSGAVPSLSATVTGLVNGDLFTDAWTGALVISGATSKNVGTYTVTAVTGGLTSDLNYAFAAGTAGSLRIDPKALTAVLAADDRTYDGTTVATGSIGLTGLVAGEVVTASGAYAFADRNAGTGKTVTATGLALSGADAGNYTLASTATDTADILKRDVTGALTAGAKTYDGTTTATGSIGLTGVLAGDIVSASGTYAFADRNAGTGKTVSASGAVLAGADAGNYSLTGLSAALADILRRSVTVAADGGFKAFGQVEPSLTYRVTVGSLVAGDAFTGALARAAGETPGDYGISRGTLALSANYDLSFTGAVFTIRQVPSNDQGGASALKHLNQSPDFTLDWDPELNLTTEGQGAQGGQSGGGLTVAALR